jgi:hypothetical protein
MHLVRETSELEKEFCRSLSALAKNLVAIFLMYLMQQNYVHDKDKIFYPCTIVLMIVCTVFGVGTCVLSMLKIVCRIVCIHFARDYDDVSEYAEYLLFACLVGVALLF